jgi:cytochrome b pre-mRNA-processing protein 3
VARDPELFEACAIPDTLDGRFDSLALHAALMIDRLRREQDGEALAQAFFDAMFRHLDLTLREIGVQDLGVGRRIKIMAEGFHGRALAYRRALADSPGALHEALRRNAYGGRSPDDGHVARLEAHVRQYAARLAATPREDLVK